MRNYRVKGIVINRFNVHEADRIITIFTRERGLIEARAKSVRKVQAKLKGALELFMLSEIELAEGRSIDVITGAQVIEPFAKFRQNLSDTSVAFYLSEALIGLLSEGEPNQEVFNLFLETLEELDRPNPRDRKREILLAHFLIKLLSYTGFRPELYSCLKCNKRISKDNNFFDLSAGGLICSDCQTDSSNQAEISDQAIIILRLLYRDGIEISQKIKAREKYLVEIKEILHHFLEYILEREVKSNRFINQINREHAQID